MRSPGKSALAVRAAGLSATTRCTFMPPSVGENSAPSTPVLSRCVSILSVGVIAMWLALISPSIRLNMSRKSLAVLAFTQRSLYLARSAFQSYPWNFGS